MSAYFVSGYDQPGPTVRFICDANGFQWRVASAIEKDTAGFGAGEYDREVREGRVNHDVYYIFDAGNWRVATPQEADGFTDIVDSERRFVAHRRLQPPAHLSWRSFCRGMLVCHQAFYARADIAKNNPYDLRYRFSADVDWCIRVMRETQRRHLMLVRVNEVVANYLDGGMTNKNHRASLIERFHVMARHYGLITTLFMHLWFVVRRR